MAGEQVKQVAPRPTLEQVVKLWAADLIPQNAPKPKDKGSLAWVRDDKLPELLEKLKAGGYK